MESIKKKLGNALDKFYEILPGNYWAFIGAIFGFLVFLVSTLLHSLTAPVNIFTQPVSSLGWGPNGSELVFKIGLIILGILLAPYILYLTRLLWTKSGEDHSKLRNLLNTLGIITALIAVIGLFNVSLWGNVYTQPEFLWHLIGAFVYFFFTMIFTIIFTISMILSKNWSKTQVIFTIIMIIEFIPFLIFSVELLIDPELINAILNPNLDERVAVFIPLMAQKIWWNFFEWLNVLSTLVWIILTGIYTVKLERNSK